MGFEPMTSSLPRKCSTTELCGRFKDRRGKREGGAGDRVRTGDVQLGRLTLYQLSYSRMGFESFDTQPRRKVEGDGFEPSKAMPADLQSAPFGRSGSPPSIWRS